MSACWCCSSVINRSMFLCLISTLMMKFLQHQYFLLASEPEISSQRALKHFGNNAASVEDRPIERAHLLASKLTQALCPLIRGICIALQHLEDEVQKGCVCLNSFQRDFFGAVGEFQRRLFWVCGFSQYNQSQQRNKIHGDCL